MTVDVSRAFECNEAEARTLTEDIRRGVEKVHTLLVRSYEWKAWRALGYVSWRDYAVTEFGISKSHAYRLLDQARVIREIEAVADGEDFPDPGNLTSEQTEALKPIVREHGPEAAAAVLTTIVQAGERPTAAAIRALAEAEGMRPAKVTQTTRTTEAAKVEQVVDLATGEILNEEVTSEVWEAENRPTVEDFVAADRSVQDARYRANVSKVVANVSILPKYDPDRVADLLDDDGWYSLDLVMRALHDWHLAIAKRRRPLTLIGGSK